MKRRKRRIAALILASSGTLFASTCDAVLETIGYAWQITDIWV